jgi:hypothetical protein
MRIARTKCPCCHSGNLNDVEVKVEAKVFLKEGGREEEIKPLEISFSVKLDPEPVVCAKCGLWSSKYIN